MKNKKIIAIILVGAIAACITSTGSFYGYYKTSRELNNTQDELLIVQEQYQAEVNKSAELSKNLNNIKLELDNVNMIVEDLKDTEYQFVYLGKHKLTHYCNEAYKHICGNGDGLTAIGTQTTVGKTVAVDPKKIPYGSQIYIEGYGWRVAEDCGSDVKGSQIDILVDTHSEAYAMGVKSGGVWMLIEKP
jgi:3D (Asp-Asp-Asp) domain-containing protein